ncbi:MAG: GNAT family N-acetyltransferase [Chloroflexi bacterium]|nr:GNAT family N-acetyltransferase [Chloroflexota bacterium]
MTQGGFIIRPVVPADQDWVRQKTIEEWGAEIIVVHSEIFHPAELPGFAAEMDGKVVGLLTYRVAEDECEILTLNSWREGIGVGAALIETARQTAGQAGCRRLYLVTTNDNTHALRFYQKRGFTICAVRLNIMDESRQIKPEISPTGEDGIPIRDEIELEIEL